MRLFRIEIEEYSLSIPDGNLVITVCLNVGDDGCI